MDNLKSVIESILFVAGDAVAFNDIAEKLNISNDEVKEAVNGIKEDFEKFEMGINLQIFNEKAQLCSNPKNAQMVAEVLNPIRERALTRVVMEVCGIIAYKQPITRLEVENLRGFNSDYAITTLLENNLIEVVGRKDAIGKPLLFGTTDTFLKKFNLTSLDDLPDYDELMERIQVLHTNSEKKDNSLFDFRDIPENKDEQILLDEPTEDDKKMIEQMENELESGVVNVAYSSSEIDHDAEELEKALDNLNFELDEIKELNKEFK